MNTNPTAVTLIGVPLEEGSGRRGAAMGPTALRIAGIDRMLTDLGHSVVDSGDLHPAPAADLPDHQKAHHRKIVGAFTRDLEARVHDVAAAGGFPLILGGDHALSMGSVSSMETCSARIRRSPSHP